MPIKLANNASARLGAPLAAADTTVVLNASDIAHFPALAAGEWHPLTIATPDGQIEIVTVTERSGNVLTVTRAQEGTTALDFDTGARAEIRLTAGSINAISADGEAYADAAVAAERAQSEDDIDALRTELTAALTPTGCIMPWSLPGEPEGWIFCDGRILGPATSYTALRAAYVAAGFPHGSDGSGNPKIPDLRGRVPAGLDNMGSGAAGRLTGAALGAELGAQTHTLSAAEMPAHSHGVSDPGHAHGVTDPTHAHSVYDPGHVHGVSFDTARFSGGGSIPRMASPGSDTSVAASATGIGIYGAYTGVSVNAAATGISTQNAGSGAAHNNVQPTLAVFYIVKT